MCCLFSLLRRRRRDLTGASCHCRLRCAVLCLCLCSLAIARAPQRIASQRAKMAPAPVATASSHLPPAAVARVHRALPAHCQGFATATRFLPARPVQRPLQADRACLGLRKLPCDYLPQLRRCACLFPATTFTFTHTPMIHPQSFMRRSRSLRALPAPMLTSPP